MYARDHLLKAMKYYQKLYLKLSERVRDTYEITHIEFDIVAFLSNNPQYNTAKDICEMKMLIKSSVSAAIEDLSTRGFISCAVDQNDRRIVRLNFLPKADALRNDIHLVQKEFSRVLFDGIPQDEIESFFSTLSKINENAINKME